MAETGSMFGELLFNEQLLKDCDNEELRIEILAYFLLSFFAGSFNFCRTARFEQSLYETIDRGETLDASRIVEIWRESRRRIYGDTIEWYENQNYAWARIGQLFNPNERFLNYNYSFAQLLVFALYEDYKQNPSEFRTNFKQLLSRGSSMSPRAQITEMGYDITRPDFWTLGIKRAEHFLNDLQRLL